MIVWVVTSGYYYENTIVNAVLDHSEKAQAFVEKRISLKEYSKRTKDNGDFHYYDGNHNYEIFQMEVE